MDYRTDYPNANAKCLLCGYAWFSRLVLRGLRPKSCPDCKSRRWDDAEYYAAHIRGVTS